MAEPSLASHNPFRRRSAAAPPASSAATAAAAALDTAPLSAPVAAHVSFAPPLAGPDYRHAFSTNSGVPGVPGAPADPAAPGASGAVAPPRPHPTGDEFRQQLSALPKSAEAPPSTTFLRPKPVKKVRVQSPPPSPDSSSAAPSPSGSLDSVDADFEARFPSNVSAIASGGGARPSPARAGGSFADYSSRGGLLDDRPARHVVDFSSESEDDDDDDDGAEPVQRQRPPPHHFQTAPGGTEPEHGDRNGLPLQTAEQPAPTAAPALAPAPAPAPAPAGKGILDVDAFSRLLLTGQGPTPARTGGAVGGATDAGSFTDASTASKHSVFETPRTSHEVSENDDDRSGLIGSHPPAQRQATQTLRKKPPPPSSRHGRLIKPPQPSAPASASASISDVGKPVPLPPSRRYGDEGDAPPDTAVAREPAAKLPETGLGLGIGFDASSDDATPSLKKLTPAPPPRRQAHSRSESRSNLYDAPADHHPQHQNRDRSPAGSPRSSFDSTRSRSSSIRLHASGAAPAPPPPRRPNHASRPSTSFVLNAPPAASPSPSAVSDTDRSPPGAWPSAAATMGAPGPGGHGSSSPFNATAPGPAPGPAPGTGGKLAKPPPPPARNTSVRHKEGRPGHYAHAQPAPSSSSHPLPPPPPRRQRGSSRGSMDGGGGGAQAPSPPSVVPRKLSAEGGSARRGPLPVAGEDDEAAAGHGAASALAAHSILADLDALQREVDALRGQYGGGGGGGAPATTGP